MSESSRAGGAAALALLLSCAPALSMGALPSQGVNRAEKARKTLILGIDGMRGDALLAAEAPRLHGLMRGGGFTTGALADRVTHSGPGWTSVLTGAWSPKHGVIDNTFEGYDREAHPHFFRRVKEAEPGAYTASIVNWEPIHGRLVTHADLSLAFGDDDSVSRRAVRLLREGDPDAVFLHFDAPDHAGHRHGFSRFSQAYLAAIRDTDRRIGAVLDALGDRPGRGEEEWLILVAADHGGVFRHHGDDDPACRLVPLIVAGDGAAIGGDLVGTGIADVAPTALAWLGVEIRREWKMDGRPVGLRRHDSDGPRADPADPAQPEGRSGSRGAVGGTIPEEVLGGTVGKGRPVGESRSAGAVGIPGGLEAGQPPDLLDQ